MEINRADGKKTELFVQMKQLDGRLFFAEKYPYPNVMKAILVCVFKLEPNEKFLAKYDPKKRISFSEKLNLRREVDTDDFEVENGRYAIIPCTKNPGEFCKYSVNVYFNCDKKEIKFSKVILLYTFV
jgi:hypothetical protein